MYKIETVINSDILSQSDFNEATEKIINSKNVKLIKNSREYSGVCFNYALNDKNGFIGNCQNAYDELKREYKQINIKEAQSGDIISYHELDDCDWRYGEKKITRNNALHFAIVKKTKGTLKSTIIKSKWGCDGVFETTLYDIPDAYGNTIVIWRKEKIK